MRKRKKKVRVPKRTKLCYKCVHKPRSKCLLNLKFLNGGCKKYHNKRTPYQLKQSDIAGIRENLAKEQKFDCPICNKKMTNDIVLDHHHKKRIKGSGLVRGAICRTCNVFIAKSENSATRYRISQDQLPAVLRRIADYLEAPQMPYIHPSEKPKEPKLKKSSYNKLVKLHKGNLARPTFDGNGRAPRLPEFPKSGKLTKKLAALYEMYELKPEYYK